MKRRVMMAAAVTFFGAGGASAQMVPVPWPQPSEQASHQSEKNSPAYRGGFSDGCVHATSGLFRNETLFRTDIAYHDGWIAGFGSCYMHQTINTNADPNGPLKGLF